MNAFSAHAPTLRPGEAMTGHWTPGSDADIGQRVARRFERAVAEPSERTMTALRDATIALATALRATALRPERAVIMLKEVLRGHGGAGWAPSIATGRGVVPTRRESVVYGEMFSWWVAAYYGEWTPEPTARRAPPPAVNA
jgi:hypothetical protein